MKSKLHGLVFAGDDSYEKARSMAATNTNLSRRQNIVKIFKESLVLYVIVSKDEAHGYALKTGGSV